LVRVVPWLQALDRPGVAEGRRGEMADPGDVGLRRADWDTLAQVASVPLSLWLAFGSRFDAECNLFFVCFLPLIWVALRRGLPGATAGVLAMNLGAVLAVLVVGSPWGNLAHLPVFMLSLSLTGLLLGAVVSDHRRAESALQEALRELEHRVDDRTADLRGTN